MNNRIPMTLDEQKKVMLNILIEFAKFCDEHNLMYYLDAGTLIGAVRHKGFIPWDDDIDVNMPQKDYDKFIELMRNNNGHLTNNFIVEFPETTIYPYIKISDNRTILIEFPQKNPMEVGVYIDVFPKYGIKDKGIKAKLVCKISHWFGLLHWFNRYSIFAWRHSGNIFKQIIAFLGRHTIKNSVIPIKLQNWLMHKYAKQNPISKCKYVTTLTNGEYNKLAPIECFDGYQTLEFEGYYFKGPNDYDTYLHCLYTGDYMELPPIEKRYHHITEVYWKNKRSKEDYFKTI